MKNIAIFGMGKIGLDRGMTGGGVPAPQVFYQRCPVVGDWPGQGERFTESPVVFEGRTVDNRPYPHGADQARSAGSGGSPCASTHHVCCAPFNRSERLPQGPKSLFLFSPRGGRRSPKRQSRQGLRSGPCTARQGEPRSGERALWRAFSFSALRKEGPPPEPSEAGPVGRGLRPQARFGGQPPEGRLLCEQALGRS